MYADTVTDSMQAALTETERRRAKQIAYNAEHGIDPTPIRKKIADVTDMLAREEIETGQLLAGGYRNSPVGATSHGLGSGKRTAGAAESELAELIEQLSEQMKAAAAELSFELAARLRDEIKDLRQELRSMREAAH